MVNRKGKVILVDIVEDLFGGVKNIAKVNLLVADDNVVDGGFWAAKIVDDGGCVVKSSEEVFGLVVVS